MVDYFVKKKVQPVRQCVVCRTRQPQGVLIRVVRTPEGRIHVDRSRHRAAGRGAYVCPQERCLQRAPQAVRRVLRGELADQFSDALSCAARERATRIGEPTPSPREQSCDGSA